MIQQPEDPLKQVAQIEQIRGMAQSQELGAVQLEEARRVQQSQQTLMSLYAKNSGDLNQTYADAASSGKVLPDQLLDFRTKSIAAQTQLATLQEKDLANRKTVNDLAANELEAIKQLPVEQRPQGIRDALGRLANNRVDIAPIANSLASLPDFSDASLNRAETGLKGEQWLVDNELKQRQLASTPTPAQAQAKTAAELDKVQSEALIAHQQLLSMPSPEEAAKSRWANLLKTQAETAAAQASTAKTKAETALIGTNPVIAFDPTTNQRVLTTMPQVGAKGFTNPVKATEGDIQKETDATKQFNDVQMNVSRYRQAILALGSMGDEIDKTGIAHILSDGKLDAGHLLNMLPGSSIAAEIQNQKQIAADWNNLSEAEQDAVTGYLRAKGSIVAFQKALTQTGRTSKEALAIEMQNLPSPLAASGPALKQMDAFQENIDTASKGLTRVPWLPSPQEVRSTIEQEGATKTAQMQKANDIFRANQTASAGAGQYTGGGSKQMGQRLYDSNKQYLGTVSKLYPDGSFDLIKEPINERLFAQ